MKTIAITNENIIRETAKAYLLSIDCKEFWVKKAWVREDFTLTPAAIKAFEEALTPEQREMEKYVLVPKYSVVEEREKIFKFKAEMTLIYGTSPFPDCEKNKKQKEIEFFMPKFAVKGENETNYFIDKDFFNKKEKELKEFYTPAYSRSFAISLKF